VKTEPNFSICNLPMPDASAKESKEFQYAACNKTYCVQIRGRQKSNIL